MSALWTGMITHLWQTTLVLALIGSLATLLRRAPARYIEGLWTVALLKLLVPLPLLVALWPALKRIGASAGQQQTIGPTVQRLSQIAYPEMLWIEPAESAAGASLTFPLVAVSVWAVGTIALLALWWRRSHVPEPTGEAPWHASDDIIERVDRAARAAGVPLSRIRITDAAVVPCVGNFRRPTVLLPRAVVRSLRDDELHAVLLHEEVHRRRGDLWRAALQRLTTCLFYFYPPAWWLTRRLRAAAEMACDEAVLATGIDARTYARALARTVVLDLHALPAPALASRRSYLGARLQRIQTPERYAAMKRHPCAIAVALIAAVGLSFVPVADGLGLPATGIPAGMLESAQGEWVTGAQLQGLTGLESRISAEHEGIPLIDVLQQLGDGSGFRVYSAEELRTPVWLVVSGLSLRATLDLIGDVAGLRYRLVDSSTIMVQVDAAQAADARMMMRTSPGGNGVISTSAIPRDLLRLMKDAVEQPTETQRQEVPGRQVPEEQPVRVGQPQRAQRAGVREDVTVTAPGPYRIGGDIEEPERIKYVAPEYPELARQARMEGFVILQAVIDREGNVRDVEVLRGLGLGLDVAAMDAVRQWKYTPTYHDGEAVEVILTVNVVFQLIQ